jgi:hypothetical protein
LILLDTNILRGMSLDSVSADLIKTIRAAGVQDVAVPWAVMEELAAQQAVRYRAKYDDAHAAVQALRRATPWPLPQMRMPEFELEGVRQHWRDVYSALVDVVPVSASVLEEALFREANLLAPCKLVAVKGQDKQEKVGARDASIWLTAVNYAREHPNETVYFVSRNTNDFGNGTSYKHPMNLDLQGLEDRFVHYTSLDDVVQEFTEPADVDEEAVRTILATPENNQVIVQEAWQDGRYEPTPGHLSSNSFRCTVRPLVDTAGSAVAGGDDIALGWIHQPAVKLHSVREISAYRIADHVWCTATARWLLIGSALIAQPFSLSGAVAAWETRVLVSPTSSDSPLTILRRSTLSGVLPEEFAAAQDAPRWSKNEALMLPDQVPGSSQVESLLRALINVGQIWGKTRSESAEG